MTDAAWHLGLYDPLVATTSKSAPEHVTDLLRDIARREQQNYATQTAMAEAMGITQGMLSTFMGGQGGGYKLIVGLARLAPRDVVLALGLPPDGGVAPGRYKRFPNLMRALEVGEDKWSSQTKSYAKSISNLWLRDASYGELIAHLDDYDAAHRAPRSAKKGRKATS